MRRYFWIILIFITVLVLICSCVGRKEITAVHKADQLLSKSDLSLFCSTYWSASNKTYYIIVDSGLPDAEPLVQSVYPALKKCFHGTGATIIIFIGAMRYRSAGL